MSRQKARTVWRSMLYRCKTHKNYAGRIKVCERWQVFENFYADMGDPPPGKSLDRYPNNHGDYEPGNCRWATQKEQIANSDQVRGIEHLTKAQAIEIKRRFDAGEHYQALADEFGCSQVTIHRIARGETYGNPPQLAGDDISAALAAINSLRRK